LRIDDSFNYCLTMFRFNLRCQVLRSKSLPERFFLRAGLWLLLSVFAVACSEENSEFLPEDFVLSGTYYLVKISRTRDGVNFSELLPPNVGGVLEINGNYYFRDMTIGETRDLGEGALDYQGKVLIFYIDSGDESKLGVYDQENDLITINYTLGDYLYTETWKRVEPTEGP